VYSNKEDMMVKNKVFQNATHIAIVLAVGLLALSFVGTQTGFVPHSAASTSAQTKMKYLVTFA